MQILNGVPCTLLLLAIGFRTREAAAAAPPEWRAVFEAGAKSLLADDCQGALSSFENARNLPNSDPIVIYEIAEAQKCLQHSVEAAEALTAYLAQSSDASPNNERAHAQAELEQLKMHLVELELVSPLPDASIRIDGRPMRRPAPGRGQWLTPGTHIVSADSSSGEPLRREVTLSEGQYLRLDFPGQDSADRTEASAPVASKTPEPPLAPKEKRSGIVSIPRGYLLVGAGVAVAGAALGFYLDNGNRYDEWKATDRALNANPNSAARAQNNQLADKIENYNVVTVVLAVTSGVLIGGGGALLAWDSRDRDPRAATAGFSVALNESSRAVTWSHAW